jgi:hypothetical protein
VAETDGKQEDAEEQDRTDMIDNTVVVVKVAVVVVPIHRKLGLQASSHCSLDGHVGAHHNTVVLLTLLWSDTLEQVPVVQKMGQHRLQKVRR